MRKNYGASPEVKNHHEKLLSRRHELLVCERQIRFNTDLIDTDATPVIERRFIANQFDYSYSLYVLLSSTVSG